MPCFYIRYTDARTRVENEAHTGRTYTAGHAGFAHADDAFRYGRELMPHADIEIRACHLDPKDCPVMQAEAKYGPAQPLPFTDPRRI